MFKFFRTALILIFCISNLISQESAIEIKVEGEGPDVIFLPGFACPGEVWQDLVSEIKLTHTCHSVSYAGFVGVEAFNGPWLSGIINELETYILKETINPILIGHSLGGTLALKIGVDQKVEIQHIVSIDGLASVGALVTPNFSPDLLLYDSPQNMRMLNMEHDDFVDLANMMAESMVLDSSHYQLISNWIIDSDRNTYVYGYTDLLKLDLRNDLSKLEVSVSIIAATYPYGKDTVAKTFKEQFKNLNDYELYYAENSGHFIMLDQPIWLMNILKEILNHNLHKVSSK